MTVNTRVIKLILAQTDLPYVELTAGLRLQVIPDIKDLPQCQKHQSAAFIATQQMLVVWEDDPKRLLDRASYIQETLMRMIWGDQVNRRASRSPYEKNNDPYSNVAPVDPNDLENAPEEKPRRTVMIQAFLTAATLILAIATVGAGWRNVAIELIVDRNYIRLAFIACMLPQLWLSLVCRYLIAVSQSSNTSSSSSKPSSATLPNSSAPLVNFKKIQSITRASLLDVSAAITTTAASWAFLTSPSRCLSTKRVCTPS